jgi:hypothetical protein
LKTALLRKICRRVVDQQTKNLLPILTVKPAPPTGFFWPFNAVYGRQQSGNSALLAVGTAHVFQARVSGKQVTRLTAEFNLVIR